MTKRIFVSIDLPSGIRDNLKLLQKPQIRWIKWMKPENLHITLNFLGDLDDGEIETAKKVLTDTVAFYKPFPMTIASVRAERDMLWLLPELSNTLYELQRELLEKFREARIGKRERRRYAPHLLFAKSKTRHGGQAGRPMIWKLEKFEPIKFTVDRIHLYESKLTPEAATHILIQSFAFTPSSSPPHEN